MGDEARDRILDAATELYGEKGYQATRVEDIVARARVSKRTVYELFRDLGSLRFAVYERAMQVTLMELARIANDDSEEDRLKAALTSMYRRIAQAPHLSRVVSYEFRLPEPKNIELRNQVVALFKSILFEGTMADHRAGICPVEPDELTIIGMLAAFEGLANHFLDGNPADAEKATDVALRMYRSVYPFEPWKAKRG